MADKGRKKIPTRNVKYFGTARRKASYFLSDPPDFSSAADMPTFENEEPTRKGAPPRRLYFKKTNKEMKKLIYDKLNLFQHI